MTEETISRATCLSGKGHETWFVGVSFPFGNYVFRTVLQPGSPFAAAIEPLTPFESAARLPKDGFDWALGSGACLSLAKTLAWDIFRDQGRVHSVCVELAVWIGENFGVNNFRVARDEVERVCYTLLYFGRDMLTAEGKLDG